MTIRFYENASSSPVMDWVPRAIAELISEGLAPDYDPNIVVGDDTIFVSFDADTGKPVAFLAYRPDGRRSAWWVLLSYTLPAYRSQGHHTRLFEAAVERAKSKGDIKRIDCGTHVDNRAAQDAFARQGRMPVGLIYSFHIRDAADGVPVEVVPENIKAFMEANDKFRMKMFVDNEGIVTITLKDGSTWQMTSAEFDGLPGKYPI